MTRARASSVALLLTLLVVAPAGVAGAHDELTGSDPEDGSTVEAPEELVLTFSGGIAELGAQVAVTGPGGDPVVEGRPVVNGTQVGQDLVEDLAAGDYEVVWRVTSEDGHPISGELGFTVEAGEGDDATQETTGAATTGSATTAVTGTGEETTDDADVTAAPDEALGAGGLPVWAWVLVALAAVGLLGLLARTWTRGRE